MNAPDREADPMRAGSLLRDVLVLVLAGGALGAGYNQLQLREGAGRGLPWIKHERRLVSLESVLPAEPGAFAPAVGAEATIAGGRPSSELTKRPERAPAPNGAAAKPESTAAKPVQPAPSPPSSPPATGSPPAGAPATLPMVPAPDLPAIPDTRDPLEVGYAIVKKLHDANAALFVDARSAEEFGEGHVPGAVNLPFDDVFKKPDLAKQIDSKGRPIVAYCGGGDCELSRNLAFSLIEAGHKKVLVFLGGTADWKEAGNALVSGARP